MLQFSGLFTALITPFRSGEVDYDSLRRLIRAQLDGGVQGFVVNGTTAESPTLNETERWQILEFVQSEVSRQIPILMGTGTFSTSQTLAQTQRAERAGADGALIVVPYYNKPPQAGLVAHFKSIALGTQLPIMLYNVPGRTVASLGLAAIQELAAIKNIVGIKEATGDLKFATEISNHVPKDFVLSSGDDGTYLDFCAGGGHGVISVLSHLIPRACRELLDEALINKSAPPDFEKFRKLTELLFKEPNPIPVKAALKLSGIITSDELRLPLVRASESLILELRSEMERLRLI